jgi:cysteine desulfurase family protein
MDKLIYLDNAATAWPKPQKVYDFMMEFYRSCGVNPGRSGFDKAIEAGNILENLRKRLTKFFGGDEDAWERLCFGYNATDALNLIIQGILAPGDHVVTTNVEHNSVIRPINCMVRDFGVEATYVPFNGQGYVEPDAIPKAIKKNTKAVFVNHGSNVIGTVQPLKEIGAVCKEKGVLFITDTSQTAGVIPINMKEMNLDILAFTGHKSMMGCTGIGGMCVRKYLDVKQTRAGGTGVKSAYPYHLEEYPYRMEYGTPNMIGVASLWAGQDWLEETGLENIHRQEMGLAEKLLKGFREIEGVIIYGCDNMKDHLSTVSINIEGWEAGDVGIMLDVDYNIATRTGLQCAPLVHQQIGTLEINGTVRFSIGAFNTEAEVDSAIVAVQEIAANARKRKNKYRGLNG